MTRPSRRVIAQYLDMCRGAIAEQGWMVQAVPVDPGTYLAYSVGLTGRNLPEVVITTGDPRWAATIVNAVGELLEDGLLHPVTDMATITVVTTTGSTINLIAKPLPPELVPTLRTACALYGQDRVTAIGVMEVET